MRVFVTGGSGFVGGHVIEGLVRDGHEVRAMARSGSSAAKVEAFGGAPVRCALGEVPASALEGCDAVVHAAAFVEEYGTRRQYWEANVEGTAQLLEAARDAGVGRFVLVGTEAALFDGGDLIDADETHPYPARHRFLYSETKAEAERRVLAANDDAMTTMSVRPCFVWGPRDNSVLPAVLRMVEDGGWVWLDGGRRLTSTTHVANLVHGIALALERGEGGEAYFVTDDENRTIREFVSAYAATAGAELPDRSLPGSVARAVAGMLEGTWRLLGIRRPPPLTRMAAAMMSRDKTVVCDKAKRELDYAPVVSVREGLADLRGDTRRAAA
ncbi:MAG TPA: NAD-dependent epimerase/dehydratase family protein [Sandaracinaceae bacterium LLY-WYZ-13_1]|nr:NAD-dependent epimerase/dehydratase family protein [Sandaracinaceae bacterium LLY-WYZ-13_1]